MVVTIRRSVRVFLTLLLLVLAGAYFLAAQPETKSASPLENLLSGSSTDIPGALSSLNDSDLPLALAVAEALKFKALHGDTRISTNTVEEFRRSIEKRFEDSKSVSLEQSEVCHVPVPARKTTMAGLELTIPACFRSEQPLQITDFGPRGEAGIPFPDVWVDFLTDHPPVQARMVVDGKTVSPSAATPGRFLFRPMALPAGLVCIGTHTVEVSLTDAAGRKASKTWCFTVGLEPAAAPGVPSDAELVGSFTISIKSLFPGSLKEGDVLVRVFLTKDGRTIYEYSLFTEKGAKYPATRSTSLFLLQDFCGRHLGSGKQNRGVWISTPTTRYIFAGYDLPLKAGYSFSEFVTVNKVTWKINQLGLPYQYVDGMAITWKMTTNTSFQVLVDVTVAYPSGPVQGQYTSSEYYVYLIDPNLGFNGGTRGFRLADTATASMPLDGSRSLWDPPIGSSRNLIEGESKPYPTGEKGILTVNRSHWKIVGGTSDAVIENVASAQTKFLFPGYGYVEVAHDVALSYDWGSEHYEMVFQPKTSGLFGIFPYKASARYAQMPPGIIFSTSRLIKFQEMDITINGERRIISSMNGGVGKIDPPIVFGQSSLFPESKPLYTDLLAAVFIRQVKDTYEQLPRVVDFQFSLKYDKMEQASGQEMLIRPYFITGASSKELDKKRDPWDDFFQSLHPLTDWVSVKAFKNPAEIVQVVIDPPDPEVYEGQKFEFTGAIVPKPGLGTGEITEKGGSLDLLDGYQSQAVEKVEWDAIFHPHHDLWKTGTGFDFQFEPKKGTGTYEIVASAVVAVKEKDTASLAKVNAISSTTALVLPGLKILTPVDGFAYLVGRKIKVTTTRDDDQISWSSIAWSINGKEWKPAGPPAFLVPETPGEIILTASQKVIQNGQEVILSDQVKFSVKPVTIQLTPVRKVVSPPPKTVPLTMLVKLGEMEIQNLDPVDWATGSMKAQVKTIEWGAFTGPSAAVPLEVNDPPLSANAQLRAEGAMTVLATVTVRVWSTDPNRPYDETVAFPAVRADLWAIPQPVWAENPEWKIPGKAIASARRTFAVSGAHFKIGVLNTVYWQNLVGFDHPIEYPSALPGVDSQAASGLSFNWSCPGNQPETGLRYVPFMKDPGSTEVRLSADLSFTPSGKIPFPELVFPVAVENLVDLVIPFIDPASFVVSPGMTQMLKFGVEPKEAPTPGPAREIIIQGGNFKVEVDQVQWFVGAEKIGEGNPFAYQPKKRESRVVLAKANVKATENDAKPPAQPSTHELTADSKGQLVRLIVYPGEGFAFPASYPVTLRADPDLTAPDNVEWSVDGSIVGKGAEVQVPGLKPGKHTIKATLSGGATEQHGVTAFSWEFSMLPDRQAVAWPGSKVSLPVWLNAEIAGQSISSGTEIDMGLAKVLVPALEIVTQSDPDKQASLSEFSKGVATCTFAGPAAFAALASASITVVQPGGLEESYEFPRPSILMGAIKAEAKYSFALEPTKAIAGTQRLFVVGSITVKVDSHEDVVIDETMPQELKPPMEIVKPIFPGQSPILWLAFDQKAGFISEIPGRYPDGISMHAVPFPASTTQRIIWQPYLKTDIPKDLALPKTERKITPQDLVNLISMKITSEKLTVPISGSTKVNFYFGPRGEEPTSQGSIKLLNGDYEVKFKEVTWYSNGKLIPTSGPAITFPGNSVGSFSLSASPTFSIEPKEGEEFGGKQELETKGPVLWVFPSIELLVNNAPLSSSKLFLGQRIKMSFSARNSDGTEVQISSYSWSIEEPVINGMKIGDLQNSGEVIPGRIENNHPAEFLLYSLNVSQRDKAVTLNYEWEGNVFSVSGILRYSGPALDSFFVRQTIPEGWMAGKTFRLGYHLTYDGPFRGHGGGLSAENPTDVPYTFYVVQLVKNNSEREFFDGKKEFVDMKDYWLDAGYPYLWPGNESKIDLLPKHNIEKGSLFDDAPAEPVQEDENKPYPATYSMKTQFVVFVMAKPGVEDAEMVPIFFYEWDVGILGFQDTFGGWHIDPSSLSPPLLIDHQEFGVPLPLVPVKYKDFPFAFPSWKKKLPYMGALPWVE